MLTPERVALSYEVAGIGSRGAALLVDHLLQGVLLVVVFVAAVVGLSIALGVTPERGLNPGQAIAVGVAILVATFAVVWGYFVFFEIAWSGQTPGKRLLGLRVMRENGYPIRPGDAVVRNLVRVVDFLPTGYVVGLLAMLLDDRARRVGDFAAGTVVVHEAQARRLGDLAAAVEALPAAGAVLRADDATLVRDFLLRRAELDARPRAALAARLAGAMAQRYGLEIQRQERGDEAFLASLVTTEA